MKLKKLVKNVSLELKKKHYLSKYGSSTPGSIEWLVGTEIKYGGYHTKVARNKVSPKDPRTKDQLKKGGMTGGDRMLHHGYGKKYAQYLKQFLEAGSDYVVAEFGILKGTGLALWCDLFPKSRIIGLDIDLQHTKSNMDNLKNLGAFKSNQPELHEFDQFVDNIKYLGQILDSDKIDICIDDGYHSNESILKTMESVVPYLSDSFVYFIEDNRKVHAEIKKLYPNFNVESMKDLTIVTNK